MAANPAMIVRIVTELEEFKRNLAEGRNQIETTTAAMQKMATSFSGDKLIQHAHNVAAAVNQIGGASKLTEAEQARVNATVGKALEKYAVLGKEAPTALRQLHEATKPLPAVNESWWSSFTKTASAYIAGIATFETAKRVFGALVDFVKSSIASYASAEAAQQKLTVAVQANGRAAPEVIQQYGKLASAFQRTTAFSDDLITEMQALLVQVGGVMPSQMKRALQASTDLAAGLGIDLRVATLAVGKAFAGETGSLSRYGIVINDAQIKAQGMTAVLDAIHARFGGQATAQLETYTGRVAAFGNAWDNIKEQLGGTILQGPILEALLRRVSAAGQAGAESADQGAVSWARFSLAIGAGPAQASVIAFLEDYADTMNEIARSHERATRIPSPFEKWAEQRAVIPGLTAGLALAEKAFADTQKQEQEAKKAAEAHAKALEALRDRFSGEGVLKQARDYEIVLGRVGGASKLTREESEVFRGKFTELIEKYRLMGPAGAKVVAHFEALREKVAPLGVEVTKTAMGWSAYMGSLEKAHGKNLLAQESIGLIEARMKATGLQVKTGSALFNELGQHIAGVPLPLSVLTEGFKSNQQVLDGIIDALPKVNESLATIPSKWSGITDGLKKVLTDVPQTLANAFTGGGDIMGAVKSIGSSIGSIAGQGIAKAMSFAGPMGQAIGSAIGSLAGPLIGMIAGLFSKPEYKEIMKGAGREFGIDISEGLAKKIAEDSTRLGDRMAAMLFHVADMVKEAGGVVAYGLDKTIAKARDLFVMIETGKLTVEDAGKAFNDVFALLAPEAIDKTTGLAKASFLELIDLSKRFGVESKAVMDFQIEQAGAVTAGWNAVANAMSGPLLAAVKDQQDQQIDLAGTTAANQDAFDRMGRLAVVAFDAALASGQPFAAALAALGPGLDGLSEAQRIFGFESSATFDELLKFRQIAQDNQELFASLDGVNQMMRGLHNLGMLTEGALSDLQATAIETFDQLVLQGVEGDSALRLMQPTLQTIWALQQDFGYAVDEGTQALLDQAVASGVVGDAQRDVQERIARGIERIADLFERTFGDTFPDAVERGASRAARSIEFVGNAAWSAATDVADASAAMAVSWSHVQEAAEAAAGNSPTGVELITHRVRELRDEMVVVTPDVIGDMDEWRRQAEETSSTRGRFLDFGSGTPAVLHGRERVVTERESIRESSLSTAALEAEFQALRRELRRDFPRAVGIAVQDAIVLAR